MTTRIPQQPKIPTKREREVIQEDCSPNVECDPLHYVLNNSESMARNERHLLMFLAKFHKYHFLPLKEKLHEHLDNSTPVLENIKDHIKREELLWERLRAIKWMLIALTSTLIAFGAIIIWILEVLEKWKSLSG